MDINIDTSSNNNAQCLLSSHFAQDEIPPCAIILEYIPDLHELNTVTYSPKRWEEALRILAMIHNAGVLHNDIATNVMIQCTTGGATTSGVAEGGERVLWLDFDRAETVEEGKEGSAKFAEEMELAVNIGRDLVS